MNPNVTTSRILEALVAARAVADVARQLAGDLPAGLPSARMLDEVGGAVLQIEAAADEVLRFKEELLARAARLGRVDPLDEEVPEVLG